ncbi:MAG: glycosyltransferase family 87 protein [Candidatus Limnocylindrus sp.]
MMTRHNIWRAGIALMVILAAAWMSYQAYRYFADPGALGNREVLKGAIDLNMRYREVQAWFSGRPVYRTIGTAVYPPATYAILGIVFNGLPWPVVKVLWFAGSLVSAGWLGALLARHSGAESRDERIFIGVMPFALYATGAAMGNGQLIVFVLPLVLCSLLMLARPTLTRRQLWVGSLFMVLSLVQPTIAAPFFWIVLFCSPRLRAAVIVVAGYVALTAVALLFQMDAMARAGSTGTPVGLMQIWTRKAQGGSFHGSITGGYGTIHDLAAEIGLHGWNWHASLLVLVLLGAWILRQRKSDIWLLMGVAAIVARVWAYHRWYNDLLLIVPLISLLRMSREPTLSPKARIATVAILVWVWAFLLAPGVLYTVPSPDLLVGIQIAGWMAALVLLVTVTEADYRRRSNTTSKQLPPSGLLAKRRRERSA